MVGRGKRTVPVTLGTRCYPPVAQMDQQHRKRCFAIDIVELALRAYGPPISVRKEIVRNRLVVSDLASRGAVFVDSVDDVPAGARSQRHSGLVLGFEVACPEVDSTG